MTSSRGIITWFLCVFNCLSRPNECGVIYNHFAFRGILKCETTTTALLPHLQRGHRPRSPVPTSLPLIQPLKKEPCRSACTPHPFSAPTWSKYVTTPCQSDLWQRCQTCPLSSGFPPSSSPCHFSPDYRTWLSPPPPHLRDPEPKGTVWEVTVDQTLALLRSPMNFQCSPGVLNKSNRSLTASALPSPAAAPSRLPAAQDLCPLGLASPCTAAAPCVLLLSSHVAWLARTRHSGQFCMMLWHVEVACHKRLIGVCGLVKMAHRRAEMISTWACLWQRWLSVHQPPLSLSLLTEILTFWEVWG